MHFINCSDTQKSLWGREIFIVAVDLYNTYHLCWQRGKTKKMWIFSSPDIDLSQNLMHANVIHCRHLPFVPGYTHTHTHTHVRAHKHTLCWDVPGCSLTSPFLYPSTFSLSIPSFCSSYQRALCPSQIERRQAISQSLSLSLGFSWLFPLFDWCQGKGTTSHFPSECCVSFQDALVIFVWP